MRPLPTLLTLAIAAAFGGFVATGINAHMDNRADAAPLPAVLPTTAALPASVAGQAVPSLAPMLEKAMPAVVRAGWDSSSTVAPPGVRMCLTL